MHQRPVTLIHGIIIRVHHSSPSPVSMDDLYLFEIWSDVVLDCVLRNKPLLLNNDSFIPYLVDALLLDPEHPRSEVLPEQKAWCQMTHAACLAQLAVVAEGRAALCRDPSVGDALRSVAEAGLCEEARQHAESALLALSDRQLQAATEGQKHVMLSCEWLCTT